MKFEVIKIISMRENKGAGRLQFFDVDGSRLGRLYLTDSRVPGKHKEGDVELPIPLNWRSAKGSGLVGRFEQDVDRGALRSLWGITSWSGQPANKSLVMYTKETLRRMVIEEVAYRHYLECRDVVARAVRGS